MPGISLTRKSSQRPRPNPGGFAKVLTPVASRFQEVSGHTGTHCIYEVRNSAQGGDRAANVKHLPIADYHIRRSSAQNASWNTCTIRTWRWRPNLTTCSSSSHLGTYQLPVVPRSDASRTSLWLLSSKHGETSNPRADQCSPNAVRRSVIRGFAPPQLLTLVPFVWVAAADAGVRQGH